MPSKGLTFTVLASIPSPSFSAFELGPLTFRAYGLMIALGVLAAVTLAGRRMAERGYSADHATGVAMWGVPVGLIGARLYHVATDWRSFQGRWLDVFKIWEGGLGILGGVIAGGIAAVAYARKHDIVLSDLFDIVAPGVPLAQAIGRWGNWFNQELFGRPTDLPWGLEISSENRPNFPNDETFHPTFLYESLWNIGLVWLLIKVDRSRRLRPWGLFAMYMAGYAAGRLWIEALRVDHASEVAGLRVNLWVFSVVLLSSLYVVGRCLRGDGSDPAGQADADEAADDDEASAEDEPVDID